MDSRQQTGSEQEREDTFTTFEIQTWLTDFILRINSYRIFLALPLQFGEKYPLYWERQSYFFFINWQAIKHPPFGKRFLNTSWAVGLTYGIVYLHFFCILTYAIIYLDTPNHFLAISLLLKYSFFFKYSCTNIFHRRSLCTFYSNDCLTNIWNTHKQSYRRFEIRP